MTHNFRTGAWRKATQTPKEHFKFLMHSTGPQRSFIHELCSQKLGNPPSNLWGVEIPPELHPYAERSTLNYVLHASKHAPHEFGRLISSHKKASGFIGALGQLIGKGAATAAKYGKAVAGFIGKNGAAIQRGVSITKDLVTTGTTIGQISGLMHHETKSKIDKIADAINRQVHALGPQKPKSILKKRVRFKGGSRFSPIVI